MANCGEPPCALEANERAALAALPAHAWEWGEWIERKVAELPPLRQESLLRAGGRQVDVRVSRMVEVFLERSGERIAVHRRKSGRNQYATTPEHMGTTGRSAISAGLDILLASMPWPGPSDATPRATSRNRPSPPCRA